MPKVKRKKSLVRYMGSWEDAKIIFLDKIEWSTSRRKIYPQDIEVRITIEQIGE